MTDKLQTVINQITQCLDGADLGLTIGQIQTMTRLSNKTVKTALKHMDVEFDGAGYGDGHGDGSGYGYGYGEGSAKSRSYV